MIGNRSAGQLRRLALLERTPSIILSVAVLNTIAGLVCWADWRATGQGAWVTTFFKYPNGVLTVLLTTVEVVLCYWVWRAFGPGDKLRNAWFFITLAAAGHFCGRLMSQGLFRLAPGDTSQDVYEAGVVIGGTIEMALLLCGLVSVARICRDSGLVGRMTALDYVILILVAANGAHSLLEIREYVSAGKLITWSILLSWPTDILVIILLMLAITIRRAVDGMGRGLIASCWAFYVAGIVLTSMGDVGLWLIRTPLIPGRLATLGWFVWFLADSAFALAPAFQVAAIERARFRAALTLTAMHDDTLVGLSPQ